MMGLVLITGPTVEPVSLAEAKLHCRVDISDDDALIGRLITVARQYVEQVCQPKRALITQTWKYFADRFPAGRGIELPIAPLASVISVAYTDKDGVAGTISASDYVVDTYSEPGRMVLKDTASWPSVTLWPVNGFEVTFTAGYGATSASVPEEFRQAILLLVGNWYENRELQIVTGAMPKVLEFAVDALLAPWRMEAR